MVKKKKRGLADTSITAWTGGDIEEESAETSRYPLDMIIPDPNQPRRILPRKIKERLYSGKISMDDALKLWIDEVKKNKVAPLYIHRLAKVIELADNIAKQGQIHDIEISPIYSRKGLPSGFDFVTVVGERRLWAHRYLQLKGRTIKDGTQEILPDSIRARVVKEGTNIRSHQVSENEHSEPLNVIERAYGLINLRREIAARKLGGNADPLELALEI